uniref:Uncharacterized protein n=1 Tax=Hippocampus comes TaxID=109280 RepID=A0A3Q3DQ89_HIPCM
NFAAVNWEFLHCETNKGFLILSYVSSILSENFLMVKGAALFLQQGSSTEPPDMPTQHKHAGDLPQHLQVMFKILRSEDRIKLVHILFLLNFHKAFEKQV